MSIHADKTQENKIQSVANPVSQKQSIGESTFQFVDNRPEAAAQRKLQEMANNRPQVSQQRAYKNIANNNFNIKQFATIKSIANGLGTIQLMTNNERDQVIQWQAEHGLSISDYGYNPNTNLIVYYTQTGADDRTVEIHVHLDVGQHGRVQAANMRWKGEGPPGIGLIGTGWGDMIVSECLEHWMPDPPRLDVRQGADL
ncbi:MAG: hypothetical protein HYZ44_00130 [Bacteroidetes bacterium]|nr:hypothetical protein [Bacteroidota bacterium]